MVTDAGKIKDLIGQAAALLAASPLYVADTLANRKGEVAALLATLGLDPTPEAVKATIAAADDLLNPAPSLEPLLKRVKDVTGWSDGTLAKTLKITRASAQAYASGRSPERLSDAQKNVLLAGLKRRHARITALIGEMER